MTGDQYDRNETVAPRHPMLRWVAVIAVFAVVAAGAWYLRETSTNRTLESGGTQSDRVGTLRQPLGGEQTSGAASVAGPRPQATTGSGDVAGAVDSPAVIKELETITGANDGHELVGRKVSMHVPVQERANDIAFWVGEKDNRLLVVMERDRRNGLQRQEGKTATHGISPVHNGQQADITGTIQKIPKAEEMYSWGLTSRDKKELAERPIYIRADSVTPQGHGE